MAVQSSGGLLRYPRGFEGVGAMAEVLDLANLSVLDCPDPEEVDGDRDATFPPSAALTNETQDSEARCLAELKRLAVQVGPTRPDIAH